MVGIGWIAKLMKTIRQSSRWVTTYHVIFRYPSCTTLGARTKLSILNGKYKENRRQ